MRGLCPLLGRETELAPTPFERDGFRLVRCRETGFVFLPNPPDYAEVRDDFPWEQTRLEERSRRLRSEPAMATLSAWSKQARRAVATGRKRIHTLALQAAGHNAEDRPLRLLDIGCSTGRLGVEACARFAEAGRRAIPIGVELSEQLAAESSAAFQPHGGYVLAEAALPAAERLAPASIDVVMMSSFLEHDARPLDLLRALRPRLAAGGAIVLKVPNFASWNRHARGARWCGFRYPDHVNYFTPATLRRLAAEAGYAMRQSWWADRSPLSDNMYAVLTSLQTTSAVAAVRAAA